ncbi:hypothetical protein GCM10027294_25960 [Marinactinospora endophytica]
MGSRKRKRVTLGEFGPVSGPVTAAGMSLAAAGWGGEFGLSPWYAVATAGACAAVTLANAARARLPVFARLHHVGCWVAYGGWTWSALAGTPWDAQSLGALAGIAVVTGISAKGAAIHVETVADHRKLVEEATRRRGLAGEWERRLATVCHIKGARVTGLSEWKRPVPGKPGETRVTGYTVLVTLPDGGYRWTDINAKRLELASSANLPSGCGIEVMQGEAAREVVIDVSTVNVLAEDLPLGEIVQRSIYDPIPVGIRRDGSIMQVNLKWAWALLIGQTGSGKSNQLTALLAYLLMCDDVVVVGIDFNGGKLFKPYLRPWLRGETRRPAIAAVATDETEAVGLLNFLIKGISARATAYSDLMEQVDDDKVPASPQVPHIVVVSDESNDLPASVKAKLVELSNRSRGVSIRGVTSALRAVDLGGKGLPIDLNKQSSVKISMQVDDDNELGYLFSWGRPPRREEIPGVGFGVAAEEGRKPALFKGPRTRPSTAAEVAVAADAWRPDLDEATVLADPDWWHGRWERAKQTWLAPKKSSSPAPQPAPSTPGSPAGSTPSAAETSTQVHEGVTAIFERLGIEVPDVGHAQPKGAAVDPSFEEIVEQDLGDVGMPSLVSEAIELCGDEDLVHMATLADRFGVSSRRVGELLRKVGVEPRRSPWRGGKAVERDVLVAARDRIRRGLQVVPDEVWTVSPGGG